MGSTVLHFASIQGAVGTRNDPCKQRWLVQHLFKFPIDLQWLVPMIPLPNLSTENFIAFEFYRPVQSLFTKQFAGSLYSVQ